MTRFDMAPESVVVIREPSVPPVPVVFDSPHSGNDYPDDYGYAVPLSALRAGEDAFIDELFGTAPAQGATLIAARFPRSYIDPNRRLDDLDARMLAAPWPEPLAAGPKTRRGKGLIWRTLRGDIPIYDRQLSLAEVQSRIDQYWRPYTEALDRTVNAAHARGGAVWHVNCHSMPSVWASELPDGGRPVLPDFILGDRDGTTCAPEFTALVRDTLAGLGYKVAVNDRFKGVEIVRRLGRPSQNRHSIQIEVTRRLYMDEATFEQNDGFPELKRNLDKLVATVCAYARDNARP